MQHWSEQIIAGMGVPRELVFGGMQYSGTNVSMRMVENAFLGYIMRQLHMLKWIIRNIATFLDWPIPNVRFKPFKMADDLQRKAFLAQLNEAGKLSDTSLLSECDYDQEDENDIMLRETSARLEATKKQQLAMAEIQAEQQLIMAKSQAKAQQVQMEAQQAPIAPGEPGGPEGQMAGGSPGAQGVEAGAGVPQTPQQEMSSPLGMGSRQPTNGGQANIDPMQIAQMISSMPPDQQQMAIENIKAQSPELAEVVMQILMQMQQGGGGGMPVDNRPLPEKLPPRRSTPSI
jgi:hypothetical protein